MDVDELRRVVEELRVASLASDDRVAAAREAVRDLHAGYRDLVASLAESQTLWLLRSTLGEPLERAVHALGIE